jgi:hypothetical protein
MPRFQLVWQPARCLGDNLKAPRHGIETQIVILEGVIADAGNEALGHLYVMLDVDKPATCRFGIRRHRWRPPWRLV